MLLIEYVVCTASLGPRLGEFDAGRVRDLSLPTMAENLGSPGGAGSEPGKAITAPPESPAGKFQLGETLPVVPARIVRRILKGDFVDMAELSEENL